MHDTAFKIGTLAMNIYAEMATASVLEVGSQSVEGQAALRDNALRTTKYVGLDMVEGLGVDIVVEPGEPFPVDDDSFDLVIASSVFEHDPMFWVTFLEMCRKAKPGGYIYINAPSNGLVHRFPYDNWRLYPDSGKALAQWAASQGLGVTLVESFVANREDDIWNDFVAVFRKGRIRKALPKVSIHEHVPCTNVITWKSGEVLNRRDATEDMILLNAAMEQANQADRALEDAKRQSAALDEKLTGISGELASARSDLAEAEDLRANFERKENELRQREEEIEQTRLERDQFRVRGAELELVNERLLKDRIAAERRLQDKSEELDRAKEEVARIVTVLADSEQAARLLAERLQLSEEALHEERRTSQWLLETSEALLLNDRWTAFVPGLRLKSHTERLRKRGLFDGEAYLQEHPDVVADGMDPLRHYLKHGIREGRTRP